MAKTSKIDIEELSGITSVSNEALAKLDKVVIALTDDLHAYATNQTKDHNGNRKGMQDAKIAVQAISAYSRLQATMTNRASVALHVKKLLTSKSDD